MSKDQSQTAERKPAWRFPRRNDGIDFVNDPSSTHFSDDPIPKLVREIVQNSLDAKQADIAGPVTVNFSETEVERDLIGADVLEHHLRACLERAESDARREAREVYAKALAVAKQPHIPCLKIQDTGTTGLNDPQWQALVVQEGAVSKGGGSPGGSYGIGKNAVLNISDLRTVFYSTRFVAGRRGRVEKLQGKATLTGHPDPDGSSEDLQHIGFYGQGGSNPVMGTAIPNFFRLSETGTGVFVLGFNPHTSNWVDQLVTAAIENFFFAIHHKRLVVTVTQRDGDTVTVDHQTIDYLFDKLKPINKGAVHYYRAIRDLNDDEVERTERIERLGRLNTYLIFAEGAPRRMALVNRNGMLVTDSREQKLNPLSPRARSLWPDFAGVVMPDSDLGDLWLRRMENPSHDSLSSGQLLNETDRRVAERRLKRARQALSEIIEQKAQIDMYGEVSNVDELAHILPDMDELPSFIKLDVKVIESQMPRFEMADQETESQGGGPGENFDEGEGRSSGGGGETRTGSGDDGNASTKSQLRRPILQRVRYIPLSSSEAVVAFNFAGDFSREVKLSLVPAGSDRDPQVSDPVAIIEATMIGEVELPLAVDNGVVSITPDPTNRTTIRIVADGVLDTQAVRLR